jgi:hypothetical protein
MTASAIGAAGCSSSNDDDDDRIGPSDRRSRPARANENFSDRDRDGIRDGLEDRDRDGIRDGNENGGPNRRDREKYR